MKIKFFVMFLGLTFVVSLIFAFPTGQALAQETIGKLVTFNGKVKLERKGETIPLKPNMALFSEDRIETKRGTAKIEFMDGSLIDIETNTDVFLEKTTKKRCIFGVWHKPYLSRTIRVNKGKIEGNIRPQKDLLTEFETPSVIAQVKQTILSIDVDKQGRTNMSLNKGEIYAISPDGWSVFTLAPSDSVRVYWDSENKTILVHSYSGTIVVNSGDTLSLVEPGDTMTSTVDPDTAATDIRANAGTIEVIVCSILATLEAGEAVSCDANPAMNRGIIAVTAGEVSVLALGKIRIITKGNGVICHCGASLSSVPIPPAAPPTPPLPPSPTPTSPMR